MPSARQGGGERWPETGVTVGFLEEVMPNSEGRKWDGGCSRQKV
jgi:hypothetical protein